jgi:hypothetical protein
VKHKSIMAATLAAVLLVPLGAAAHHSFAVFFDDTRNVRVEGVVTAFRFTNPHATIVLDVVASDGQTHEWRAETNAPVVLQRRGWNRTSLKAGDRVTLDGWPSRDGRLYMRLRSATDADGRAIGSAPFSANDD